MLATTVEHQKQFDETVHNFQVLITGLKNRADPIADSTAAISNAAGSLSDLLSDNRPLLKDTVGYLEAIQAPLVDRRDEVSDFIRDVPTAYRAVGRATGTYGDGINFYLCDISVKVNGLQPGGPVRTVKITTQPSGRCTPQ